MSELTGESSEKNDNVHVSTGKQIEVQTGLESKYFQGCSGASAESNTVVSKPCHRVNTCTPKAAEKQKDTSSRMAQWQPPVKPKPKSAPQSITKEEKGNAETYHATSAQGSKEANSKRVAEKFYEDKKSSSSTFLQGTPTIGMVQPSSNSDLSGRLNYKVILYAFIEQTKGHSMNISHFKSWCSHCDLTAIWFIRMIMLMLVTDCTIFTVMR